MSLQTHTDFDHEIHSSIELERNEASDRAAHALLASIAVNNRISDNSRITFPSPFRPSGDTASAPERSLENTSRPDQQQREVVWAANLSDGFRRALSEGKPMVILFGAEWCGACTKLKDEVLKSPEFNSFESRGVFVHADPDKDDRFGNVRQKMAELGIDSFPTMVVLEVPSMQERARVTGRWIKDIYVEKMRAAFDGKSDVPVPAPPQRTVDGQPPEVQRPSA